VNLPIFINKRIFWDADINAIDLQLHKDFIITKVFEWGNLKEFKALMNYYPQKQVCEALLTQPYLSKVTHSFASVLFDIPKEKFKCYTNRQLQPHAWPL
jgi:hypothetical protein